MTEITTTEQVNAAGATPTLPPQPADILMNLIVALLAPMFLCASAGDIRFARLAAMQTVNAYRVRNQLDLVAVAQVIGCGLAALGSLSLSMTENISLSMTLRLRGNAVALNRVAQQNRRALQQTPSDNLVEQHPAMRTEPETRTSSEPNVASEALEVCEPQACHEIAAASQDDLDKAARMAGMAASRAPAAETGLRAVREKPTCDQLPVASTATPPTIDPPMTTAHRNQAWADVMIAMAGQVTAGLHDLPATERKAASIRADALASTASTLLLNLAGPPLKPIIRGLPTSPTTT